jgi:hypothetical protein
MQDDFYFFNNLESEYEAIKIIKPTFEYSKKDVDSLQKFSQSVQSLISDKKSFQEIENGLKILE